MVLVRVLFNWFNLFCFCFICSRGDCLVSFCVLLFNVLVIWDNVLVIVCFNFSCSLFKDCYWCWIWCCGCMESNFCWCNVNFCCVCWICVCMVWIRCCLFCVIVWYSVCVFWFSILVVVEGVGVLILVIKLVIVKLILCFIVLIMGKVDWVMWWVKVLLLKYYKFFKVLFFWDSNIMFILLCWLVMVNVLMSWLGVFLFCIIEG